MKQINVYFEEEEFKKLSAKKKGKNWHDFILLNAGLKIKEKE